MSEKEKINETDHPILTDALTPVKKPRKPRKKKMVENGILDESIIRPACRDCLSTASLKNFPAVFLSEAENAYTLAIGLNLILPTGEHMVDHILRIWANCCGFLLEIRPVPFHCPLVAGGQMIRICLPLALIFRSRPFTELFSGACRDSHQAGRRSYQDRLMHILVRDAIISIVKADMEVAGHLSLFPLRVLILHGGKGH